MTIQVSGVKRRSGATALLSYMRKSQTGAQTRMVERAFRGVRAGKRHLSPGMRQVEGV